MRGKNAATVTAIENGDEARALAAHLHSPERDRPVALISIAVGRDTPFIDAARIARELSGSIDVYTIPTGPLTFAFRDAMPPGTEAYGGAGRVYPVGTEWMSNLRLSPLRFAFDAEHAIRTTDFLIDDAHRMSDRARSTPASTQAQSKPLLVRTEVEVRAVLGDTRAVVHTESGKMATVAQERIMARLPIPLSWLLRVGMSLTGILNEQAGSFIPDRPKNPLSLAEPYETGSVVLALVAEVDEGAASLLLHPWLRIAITTADVSPNTDDTLSMLLTPGEVVAARLLRDSSGRISLRLADVGDDEPVRKAIPFAPGGAPWLLPDRSLELTDEERAEDDEAHGAIPAGPSGVPGGGQLSPRSVRPIPKPGPGPRHPATQADHEPKARRASASPRRVSVPFPGEAPAPGPAEELAASASAALPAESPEQDALGSSASEHIAPGDAAPEHAGQASAPPTVLPGPGPRIVAPADQDTQQLSALRIEAERERLRRVRAEHRLSELERQLADDPGDVPDERRAMTEAFDEERAQTAEQIAKHKQENDRLKSELRKLKSELRKTRRPAPEPLPQTLDFESFPTPEEAVRHAILLTWVAQIPSYDKPRQPLPDYRLSPGFADSMRGFDDDRQAKALRAIVDLLVGNKNRTSHHLRHGDAGPPRTRAEDGAIAWRVYIEENTPQARRLHYWLLKGGEIELARVVLHDDYSI